MKIILIIILSLLTSASIDTKAHLPKIEIYRLKDFFKSPEHRDGVAGHFLVTEEELADTPFIRDEEIVGYDALNYTITFSKSGTQKIKNLTPALPLGVQFVLAVDKNPILTGYIVNKFSSWGCASYVLFNVDDTSQQILKGLPEAKYFNTIKEARNNKDLIAAFKVTKRLR